MTRQATALYQELVLEHGRHPRNEGPLARATHEATAHNPLCGDRVTVRLRVRDGRVDEARFEGRGCMIARASASLLTEAILDHTVEEARSLAATIEALANGDAAPEDIGALGALGGVREFPARRACVLLAWGAMTRALVQPSRSRPDAAGTPPPDG